MTLELQVLQGEQQGARIVLPEGRPVTVSGAFDSDVVLRGEGLLDRRVALTARDGLLDVQVLQGEVECNGRRLAAGERATVPLGTPLALGGTHIGVVGEAAPATAAAPAVMPAPAPQAAASPWSRRLGLGGIALAAVSVGVLAFAYGAAPARPGVEERATRAEALLRGAGLAGLTVRAQRDGTLRIDGTLETQAQRAQAEQLLAGERLHATWQVFVNEQVAAAVQDVFRANGVSARVEAVGPGAMRALTAVADAAALEPLRATARRDVPGLAALEIRNDPHPAPIAPVAIDDPGKRVASIVPGDPPYVVTVDGTRYFEGALLPTGHRIAGIGERQVVLEINGVKTPLVF